MDAKASTKRSEVPTRRAFDRFSRIQSGPRRRRRHTYTYSGKFAGTAGNFYREAVSRDVPLRFLPENLGVPMLVARVGYNDGLDKDVFTVAQNDLHPQRTVKATYINGMYMKDTRIGPF